MTSAKLKGSILSTGGRMPQSRFIGDNNGSTNPSNWDYNYDLGTNGQVALAHDVTGLTEIQHIFMHLRVIIHRRNGGTTWSLFKPLRLQAQ